MQEIDNCPVCNTTCVLEHGVEKGSGVWTDKEIAYATCKTCKTRWRRRDDHIVPGKIIFEKWACRIPEITVPIPFIGGGIKLGPRWCRWIKVKEKQLPVSTLSGMKSEEPPKKGKVVEETIALSRKDFAVYDFSLIRGDKIEGEIVSDEPVDVWFFDKRNLDRFLGDRSYVPEDVSMGIYEMKIDFKAPKKSLWFLVIEHPHKTSTKVKVHLYSLPKNNRK